MKQRIINYLLRHLLGAPLSKDIMTSDKAGNIYVDSRKLDDIEIRQLQAEVKALEGFMVWKLMAGTLKEEAYKRGFINATTMEQVNTGKIIYYSIDIQESIMRIVKNKP